MTSHQCDCPDCGSRRPVRSRRQRRLAGVLAAVVGLGALSLFGGYSVYSASEGRVGNISSGTVAITLTEPGSAKIEDTLSDFLPGDWRDRSVTVNNGSSNAVNNGELTLTGSVSTSNLLTEDTTNGLQVQVWSCDEEYDQTGSGPYTFTCEGDETPVVGPTNLLALDDQTLADPFTASAGWYRIRVSLPDTAGNTMQGLSTNATWTFDLAQRAGQQL